MAGVGMWDPPAWASAKACRKAFGDPPAVECPADGVDEGAGPGRQQRAAGAVGRDRVDLAVVEVPFRSDARVAREELRQEEGRGPSRSSGPCRPPAPRPARPGRSPARRWVPCCCIGMRHPAPPGAGRSWLRRDPPSFPWTPALCSIPRRGRTTLPALRPDAIRTPGSAAQVKGSRRLSARTHAQTVEPSPASMWCVEHGEDRRAAPLGFAVIPGTLSSIRTRRLLPW